MAPHSQILVVDDNIAAASAMQKLLTLRGYEVSVAHTGAEAITLCSSMHPRIVLLDIGLPDMEGYDVATTLRELGYEGALIALTGFGQDGDREKADTAGFNFHLTKPAGLKEIEEIFDQIP